MINAHIKYLKIKSLYKFYILLQYSKALNYFTSQKGIQF